MKKTMSVLSIVAAIIFFIGVCMEIYHICMSNRPSFYQLLPFIFSVIPLIILAFVSGTEQVKMKRYLFVVAITAHQILCIFFEFFQKIVLPTPEVVIFKDTYAFAILHFIILSCMCYCTLFPKMKTGICVGAAAVLKNIALGIYAVLTYHGLPEDFYFILAAQILFDVVFSLNIIFSLLQDVQNDPSLLDDSDGYCLRTFLESYAGFHFADSGACEYVMFYDCVRENNYTMIEDHFFNKRDFILCMAQELSQYAEQIGIEDFSEKTKTFIMVLKAIENTQNFDRAVFKLINLIQFDKRP